MRAVAPVLALLGALLATAAGAQQPAEIALRFAWPKDLRASVQVEKWQRRTGSDARDQRSTTTYRLGAQADARGIVVRADSIVVDGEQTGTDAIANASGLWPAFLVDADGTFQRVLDREAVRQAMKRVVAAMPRGEREQPVVTSLLATMSTDAMIDAVPRHEWDAMVAMWLDADITIGDTLAMADSVVLPLLPDRKVAMETRITALGWTACGDGGAARCVRLEVGSRLTPESARAAGIAMIERLAGKKDADEVSREAVELQQETVTTLVTEPSTLVPHRLTIVRRTTTRSTRPGARGEAPSVDERGKTLTFRYDAAR